MSRPISLATARASFLPIGAVQAEQLVVEIPKPSSRWCGRRRRRGQPGADQAGDRASPQERKILQHDGGPVPPSSAGRCRAARPCRSGSCNRRTRPASRSPWDCRRRPGTSSDRARRRGRRRPSAVAPSAASLSCLSSASIASRSTSGWETRYSLMKAPSSCFWSGVKESARAAGAKATIATARPRA